MKKGNTLRIVLVLAAVSVVVGLLVLAFSDVETSDVPTAEPPKQGGGESNDFVVIVQPTNPVSPVATSEVVQVVKPKVGLYTHMTDEDRKVALAIQDALDKEDFESLKDLVERARKCKNAEIRRLMVEALEWFDTKAMLQLALFLDDEDDEVRESAVKAWEQVLQHVEDEEVKAGLLVESLQIVKNEDDAETIASEFHTIDQKLAIDSMIKLLYGFLSVSKEARTQIKETYRFITGEEYTNASDARQWLRENYVPPEKD